VELVFVRNFSQAPKSLLGIFIFFLGISEIKGIIPEFQELQKLEFIGISWNFQIFLGIFRNFLEFLGISWNSRTEFQ
jgi:hypothetical protein